MARTRTCALGIAALLLAAAFPAPAAAAPTKAELFGQWEVKGSDADGNYTGTLWISNGDARRVKVNAALRYDTGQTRRWRSHGWYVFGRIYCKYDLGNTSGIIHGLSGPQPPMAHPVRCTYTPSNGGFTLEGRQTDAGGLRGTETLSRNPSDLVLRYQVETDAAKRRALALALGRIDDPRSTDAILEAFGLKGMKVTLDPAEIARQKQLPGAIPFHTALLYAVDSFQNDGDDAESPHALMIEEVLDALALPWSNPLPAHVHALTVTRVRSNMRQGELSLMPTTEAPEGGESVQQNWVFSLSMNHYSDHGHWAVIDRSGQKAVYNYGFN